MEVLCGVHVSVWSSDLDDQFLEGRIMSYISIVPSRVS